MCKIYIVLFICFIKKWKNRKRQIMFCVLLFKTKRKTEFWSDTRTPGITQGWFWYAAQSDRTHKWILKPRYSPWWYHLPIGYKRNSGWHFTLQEPIDSLNCLVLNCVWLPQIEHTNVSATPSTILHGFWKAVAW